MEIPSGLPPGIDAERVPSLAKALFGVEPDGDIQGHMAYFLLANAPPDASRDYHSLAIDLLRSAVERIPQSHPDRPEWLRVLHMADGQQHSPHFEWEEVIVEETARWLSSPDGLDPSASRDDAFEHWDEIAERLRLYLRLQGSLAKSRLRLRVNMSLAKSRLKLLDESETAVRDAISLAQAIHSVTQKLDSEEFQQKVEQAHLLAGLVYNFRAAVRTSDEDYADLARAVLFYGTLIASTKFPEPVGLLIGTGAELEAQGHYATLLLRQAQRTPDSALIAASIVVLAQAMLSLPDDAPEQPGYLGNLAVCYALRHQRTGTRRDLDRAITCAERSVALTAPDDPNLPGRRSRIGGLYWERAERTRAPADYDQALKVQEEAVAAAKDDDPNLRMYLDNLARMHHGRHRGRR